MNRTAEQKSSAAADLSVERYRPVALDFMKRTNAGSGGPSLDRLRTILAVYTNFPYENLSKIIKLNSVGEPGRAFRMPDEVFEDHFSGKLGGTCFSLTFFLECILASNGFSCYKVTADMKAGRNIHCALVVMADGQKFLVDPGYLLTEPLQLRTGHPVRYQTPSTGVQLQAGPAFGSYNLFTWNRQESKWRYRFVDEPVDNEDFRRYWLESFSKPSMNSLQLTRISKDGYLYVRNTFMREVGPAGKKNMNLENDYHHKIHELFGLDETFVEKARSALDQNLAKHRNPPS